VLRAGEMVQEADLIAFCRELIASYKCPKTIEFVDELPRLPTGKISKVVLRQRFSR
jgi:acyl-CoA synthetase (AMP-forming)/AMP-acid ligase II